MERSGPTMIEEVCKNDPWEKDWFCPRKSCHPCKSRAILAQETEDETLAMAILDPQLVEWPRCDNKSILSCIGEAVN